MGGTFFKRIVLSPYAVHAARQECNGLGGYFSVEVLPNFRYSVHCYWIG
jgi:hypothetical protein